MYPQTQDDSIEMLQEIRGIMNRSSRFLSLSGWSGVWAGCTAIAGAVIAYLRLCRLPDNVLSLDMPENINGYTIQFFMLAAAIFIVALAGAFFFTYKKTKQLEQKLWSNASRQLLIQGSIPMLTGGIFVIAFILHGDGIFVAPTCLVFYGLALISASKYTMTDIRYLGLFEIILGCINLFLGGYGLIFWTLGFGVLHIIYGLVMWNKYDKRTSDA